MDRGPSRSNCLLWAVAFWWRRHRKGYEGHVTLRKSRWGYFPHVCYLEHRPRTGTIRLVSYKPLSPRKRLVPPPLFHGFNAWGDNPHAQRDPPAVSNCSAQRD
jgi:hypothetical protein